MKKTVSDAVDPTSWAGSKDVPPSVAKIAAKIILDNTGAFGQISWRPSGSDDVSVTAEVIVGDTSAMLKVFNSDDFLAIQSFEAMLEVTHQIAGNRLYPEVFGISVEHLLIVFEKVAEPTLSSKIDEATFDRVALDIGKWCSQFANLSPKRTMRFDNWFDYLQTNYAQTTDKLKANEAFLRNLPIESFVLSSGYVTLGSFANDATGTTVRKNLPTLTSQPALWELLLLGKELVRKFPERKLSVADCLARQWLLHHQTRSISENDLEQLFLVFFELIAVQGQIFKQQRRDRYADAYNANRRNNEPVVQATFISPRFRSKPVVVSGADVAALERHLKQLLGQSTSEPIQCSPNENRLLAAEQPDEVLTDLCASCAGNCCSHGRKNFAYLSASDLLAFKQSRPELSEQQVVDLYISQIPDEHMESGCLFQGELGCTLPRKMRSFTCNNYLCSWALDAVKRNATRGEDARTNLYVAIDQAGSRHFSIKSGQELTKWLPPTQ